MKSIKDAKIAKKKVLLRVDFNVSVDKNGNITDDSRIKASRETIDYLLSGTNRLILVSHFGRPNDREPEFSLKIVAEYLQKLYPDYKIKLIDDFLSPDGQEEIANQKENEIILLENIRFYPEEKENDPEFSKSLADLADIYVNDAFAVSHRSHASTVGVANEIPGYSGYLLEKEVSMISKILKNPKSPSVAIIGGAKISTKIGLIERLMDIVDKVIVVGGLANTLLSAKGVNIGQSICENDAFSEASILFLKAEEKNSLILPVDFIVGDPQNSETKGKNKKIDELEEDDNILDIGQESIENFRSIIASSNMIIWNGPAGLFENPMYRAGTDAIYEAIVENNDAVSIVGGGDTLAAIKDKKDNDKITHISTGGGAMLELIEKGTLVGIEALNRE